MKALRQRAAPLLIFRYRTANDQLPTYLRDRAKVPAGGHLTDGAQHHREPSVLVGQTRRSPPSITNFPTDSKIFSNGEWTRAQRRTARVLGQLERSGHVVLHDRAVPGATLVLHHLVVGPSGVQVMTDQDGRGEVHYRRDGAWLDSLPLRGVLATTAALAAEVARHLSSLSPPPAVEPILVPVDANVLWRDGTIDGVTLLGLREVVPHVLRRRPRPTAAQVAKLAETASRSGRSDRLARGGGVPRRRKWSDRQVGRGVRARRMGEAGCTGPPSPRRPTSAGCESRRPSRLAASWEPGAGTVTSEA